MLFPYILTLVTCLFCENLNVEILFLRFLQKLVLQKILGYTVMWLTPTFT